MKKTYQIEKQRAKERFRAEASSSPEQIQFALPLPEVLQMVQEGLMKLALAAFQQLAEALMRWVVGRLVRKRHLQKSVTS